MFKYLAVLVTLAAANATFTLCDQMAILFFQYLPICNNKMCPMELQKSPQRLQRFSKC